MNMVQRSILHPGGSVGVLSTAREDWSPPIDSLPAIEDERPEVSVKIKERHNDDSLGSCQQSQADWIRQYVEQQLEVL